MSATTPRSKRTPIDSLNGTPSGLATWTAQTSLAREKLSQGRSLLGFFHQHAARGSRQHGHRDDPQCSRGQRFPHQDRAPYPGDYFEPRKGNGSILRRGIGRNRQARYFFPSPPWGRGKG